MSVATSTDMRVALLAEEITDLRSRVERLEQAGTASPQHVTDFENLRKSYRRLFEAAKKVVDARFYPTNSSWDDLKNAIAELADVIERK